MPWKESHNLQFRWEVFNVLNLTRFDVQTINNSITNASTFGQYSSLLTNALPCSLRCATSSSTYRFESAWKPRSRAAGSPLPAALIFFL
jgi:hypothetical protein